MGCSIILFQLKTTGKDCIVRVVCMVVLVGKQMFEHSFAFLWSVPEDADACNGLARLACNHHTSSTNKLN